VPSAYVLINYDLGAREEDVINKLSKLSEVVEIHAVSGAYDLLVKVNATTMEKLREIISWRIRVIEEIRSTQSLIAIEGQG
jgi:DNA-binding Lrp family transcriptional regulator